MARSARCVTLFLTLSLLPLTASAQGSLRLSVVAPSEVRAGETVPITLRAVNTSDRPLDLYLRGRTIAFDVIVASAGGDTVWRRLEGEIIPAILQLKTLAPRETLELSAEWDQRDNRGRRVSTGVYSVRALLLTDSAPLATDAAELRVTPR
jgi:hypothetical protein